VKEAETLTAKVPIPRNQRYPSQKANQVILELSSWWVWPFQPIPL
jgi:hypothetical protein